MTRLLFKVEKDGKAIGYLRIDHIEPHNPKSGMAIWLKLIGEEEWVLYDWYDHHFDSIHLFICRDKNGKEVWQDNEVWLKRNGFNPQKCTAIAAYESWVWLYWKDYSTYHWEVAIPADIEIIKNAE